LYIEFGCGHAKFQNHFIICKGGSFSGIRQIKWIEITDSEIPFWFETLAKSGKTVANAARFIGVSRAI
jgi:hypothetical protein